jgi:hypothetical protein
MCIITQESHEDINDPMDAANRRLVPKNLESREQIKRNTKHGFKRCDGRQNLHFHEEQIMSVRNTAYFTNGTLQNT